MARIECFNLTGVELGRLCRVRVDDEGLYDFDYDSAERVATFLVPSDSEPNVARMVQVDFDSCEVLCSCPAMSRGEDGFREAHRMPYRREAAAAPLEILAHAKGYGLLPLITRAPRNMCPHCRKARRWLQRHGLFNYFEMKEAELMERATALPVRKKSA